MPTNNTTRRIPVSSPELADAYRWWLNPRPSEPRAYVEERRRYGLCNWMHWVTGGTARSEMEAQFRAAGLDDYYPFGEEAYNDSGDMSADPNRIAWVEARLADYDESRRLPVPEHVSVRMFRLGRGLGANPFDLARHLNTPEVAVRLLRYVTWSMRNVESLQEKWDAADVEHRAMAYVGVDMARPEPSGHRDPQKKLRDFLVMYSTPSCRGIPSSLLESGIASRLASIAFLTAPGISTQPQGNVPASVPVDWRKVYVSPFPASGRGSVPQTYHDYMLDRFMKRD